MCNIKLQSSDGKIFDVEVKIAKYFINIKEEHDTDEKEKKIVLNVDSKILRKIIEWITHHKDDLSSSEEDNIKWKTNDIDPWNAEFLDIEENTFFDLMLAAYNFNIKELLNVTCLIVAKRMMGKTPEEIRRAFNIENDFTLEEAEKLRKDNEWSEIVDP